MYIRGKYSKEKFQRYQSVLTDIDQLDSNLGIPRSEALKLLKRLDIQRIDAHGTSMGSYSVNYPKTPLAYIQIALIQVKRELSDFIDEHSPKHPISEVSPTQPTLPFIETIQLGDPTLPDYSSHHDAYSNRS